MVEYDLLSNRTSNRTFRMLFSAAAPFYPTDEQCTKTGLLQKASDLRHHCARLEGKIAPATQDRLLDLMKDINSYYSNLIEGNGTEPYEIRQAHRGEFSEDPTKRDLQFESIAHVKTQLWLEKQELDLKTLFSPDFIKNIHRVFCEELPESLLRIETEDGHEVVMPGSFRERSVIVGRHIAPDHSTLNTLMNGFQREYCHSALKGDRHLIAIVAAHHRFVWVHPFLDGNGRVGRLLTDAALKTVGLSSIGIWSLSRGLARTNKMYKELLARADYPAQGTSDGRGPLSLNNLVDFCNYMLDQAIDQVTYISGLLEFSGMSKRIEGYIQARGDHRVSGVTGALKPEAGLILYHAFMAGEVSRAHAIQMCPGGERNARRLLKQLKDEGLLSETSSRSPLKWEIPEHALPWYFPSLEP